MTVSSALATTNPQTSHFSWVKDQLLLNKMTATDIETSILHDVECCLQMTMTVIPLNRAPTYVIIHSSRPHWQTQTANSHSTYIKYHTSLSTSSFTWWRLVHLYCTLACSLLNYTANKQDCSSQGCTVTVSHIRGQSVSQCASVSDIMACHTIL